MTLPHFVPPTDNLSGGDFFLASQNIQQLAEQRAKVSAIIDMLSKVERSYGHVLGLRGFNILSRDSPIIFRVASLASLVPPCAALDRTVYTEFFGTTPSVVIGQLLRSAFWNREDSLPVREYLSFAAFTRHAELPVSI